MFYQLKKENMFHNSSKVVLFMYSLLLALNVATRLTSCLLGPVVVGNLDPACRLALIKPQFSFLFVLHKFTECNV